LNRLDFYLWEHLKTLVYAAPVDNKEALYHYIADACQTICNYLNISEWMQQAMARCVKDALNLMEGILSTYCKCPLQP
jgi:hypothetical protein